MDIEKIKERCKLKNYNSEVFVKWFSLRFPNESNKINSYVDEWIDRFKGGEPRAHMDAYSTELYYKELRGDLNE